VLSESDGIYTVGGLALVVLLDAGVLGLRRFEGRKIDAAGRDGVFVTIRGEKNDSRLDTYRVHGSVP
jgi:hypothetical protein